MVKVVLTTDIKAIGKRGEIREVTDGYYRNFLLPKGLAVLPNDPRAAKLQGEIKAKEQADAAEREKVKQLAEQLSGQRIELSAKSQGDKLFGAIHETQLAQQLGIDKKLIKMTPIKTIGEHQVTVELPYQQRATVTVVVRAA